MQRFKGLLWSLELICLCLGAQAARCLHNHMPLNHQHWSVHHAPCPATNVCQCCRLGLQDKMSHQGHYGFTVRVLGMFS